MRGSIQPVPHGLGPALRLWLADLDHPHAHEGVEGLSPDEQARMHRFRFEHDARRYAAGHLALREVLAAVLGPGVASTALRFVLGPYGKPQLDPSPPFAFNLSHSGPWALVAVHATSPIGVDIEAMRPHGDVLALARQNFSVAECAGLARSSDTDTLADFLACWTRKEACLKALGSGLSLEPSTFDTGPTAGPTRTQVGFEGLRHALTVVNLPLPVAAAAAVAWVDAPPSSSGDPLAFGHRPLY